MRDSKNYVIPVLFTLFFILNALPAHCKKHPDVSSENLYRYLETKLPRKELHKVPGLVKDIKSSAAKHGISSRLLAAVVVTESKGNAFAKSKKGALGLTQVKPKVWLSTLREAGIISCKHDLYKQPKSLDAGAFILRHYQELHKTKRNPLKAALTAYGGHSSVYIVIKEQLNKIYALENHAVGG